MNPEIPTLKDIQDLFQPVLNVNQEHKKRLSNLDKIAVFVTTKVGTMGFFLILSAWTFSWLVWNILAPSSYRFDPYPAFVLWLFISNLIQLHLMPLIMIGQNIQGKHAELRADIDLRTDTKAEKEIETILLHLEHQQKVMLNILKHIETIDSKK